MGEMRLESKFATVIAPKLAEEFVRDKLGYNVAIRPNRLRMTVLEDKMCMGLNVNLELTREELDKLLKNVGL